MLADGHQCGDGPLGSEIPVDDPAPRAAAHPLRKRSKPRHHDRQACLEPFAQDIGIGLRYLRRVPKQMWAKPIEQQLQVVHLVRARHVDAGRRFTVDGPDDLEVQRKPLVRRDFARCPARAPRL